MSEDHGHNRLVRFGVSIDAELLKQFDRLIEQRRYVNRSEAIRDLIRDNLVEREWSDNRETVGTITIVYHHGVRELLDRLTNLQHRYARQIRSSLHVHLDAHHCLEVLVVSGKSAELRRFADSLIGTKGVKHGKLTMTTAGRSFE